MRLFCSIDQRFLRFASGVFLQATAVFLLLTCASLAIAKQTNQKRGDRMDDNSSKNPAVKGRIPDSEIPKTNVEWRKRLTAEQFEIARRKGTERAFQENTGTQRLPAHIGASAAVNPYFAQVKNLRVDVVGQVFTHQLTEQKTT